LPEKCNNKVNAACFVILFRYFAQSQANLVKSGQKHGLNIYFYLHFSPRIRRWHLLPSRSDAGVAKLADAPDLGSGAARRGGSSPSTRTITPNAAFGLVVAAA